MNSEEHLATQLQAIAESIARDAAVRVEEAPPHLAVATESKSSEADVVTATDKAVELFIREQINLARPGDSIMGEEGQDHWGTSGVEWVIDPIDGTVNFTYGIPAYAVSIGVRVDGQPTVGVVVNASTAAIYSARAGGEASRNGMRVAAREPESPGLALIATGFGYDASLRAQQGACVASLLPNVRDIRRIGSCALDLCGVAEGSVNGYVEEGPHLWDYAAGQVIAAAAGARFDIGTSPRGKPVIHAAPTGYFSYFQDLLGECGFIV